MLWFRVLLLFGSPGEPRHWLNCQHVKIILYWLHQSVNVVHTQKVALSLGLFKSPSGCTPQEKHWPWVPQAIVTVYVVTCGHDSLGLIVTRGMHPSNLVPLDLSSVCPSICLSIVSHQYCASLKVGTLPTASCIFRFFLCELFLPALRSGTRTSYDGDSGASDGQNL